MLFFCMRKRKNQIMIHLSDDEMLRLNIMKEKCSLSREAYVRNLIDGYVPKTAPSDEYLELTRELRAIGNNLNQLAIKANARGILNMEQINKECEKLDLVLELLFQLNIMPEKMEDT